MSQVHVEKQKWVKITDSDSAKLHVKIPFFSKVYYVETTGDPNDTYPKPTDADEIKMLVSPNHAASFVNVDYNASSSDDSLWMYSTNCDIYVIVE